MKYDVILFLILKLNFMKKIILLLISPVLTFSLFGQNLSLSNSSGLLNSGDTVTLYIPNDVAYEEHVYVTNSGSTSIDVKVRKNTIELLPGAFNTFCWGQCFSPTVDESPYPISIGPGETNSNGFYADYNAYGSDGLTVVRYTFFDADQPADSVAVILKFYTSPVSVPVNFALKAEISNPYPNPASSKCQFNYSVPMNVADAKIVIMDLAGNIIHSVNLIPGDGKASVDVTAFASGIYFYSLWISDKPVTTRKMIIQK
jgi:hypothetical protein